MATQTPVYQVNFTCFSNEMPPAEFIDSLKTHIKKYSLSNVARHPAGAISSVQVIENHHFEEIPAKCHVISSFTAPVPTVQTR